MENLSTQPVVVDRPNSLADEATREYPSSHSTHKYTKKNKSSTHTHKVVQVAFVFVDLGNQEKKSQGKYI